MHSENPFIYSRQDISKRETELGLTRKKASTTANQALEPANMLKRQLFWTTPLPTGCLGIPRQVLIDIDECGLWLEKGNRKHGMESHVGLCAASVREGSLHYVVLVYSLMPPLCPRQGISRRTCERAWPVWPR